MTGDNAISASWLGDTLFGSTASSSITLFFFPLPTILYAVKGSSCRSEINSQPRESSSGKKLVIASQ